MDEKIIKSLRKKCEEMMDESLRSHENRINKIIGERITPSKAAKLLRVSPGKFKYLIERNIVDYCKVEGKVYYSKQSILELKKKLDKREVSLYDFYCHK